MRGGIWVCAEYHMEGKILSDQNISDGRDLESKRHSQADVGVALLWLQKLQILP